MPITDERIKEMVGEFKDTDAFPWSQYRIMVIRELERINDTLDRIGAELTKIKTEVELLKYKASVWGVISGTAAGVIVTLGAFIIKQYGG